MELERKIRIKVGGERYEVDFELFKISDDISGDMTNIAALMAFWGELSAQAESEKIMADTYYRKWRAEIAESKTKGSKEPEWKVTAAIEAMPLFEKYKKAIAQATYNYQTLQAICRALQQKAHLLQSKGAMLRTELLSTGISTPAAERSLVENKRRHKDVELRGAARAALSGSSKRALLED